MNRTYDNNRDSGIYKYIAKSEEKLQNTAEDDYFNSELRKLKNSSHNLRNQNNFINFFITDLKIGGLEE